MERKTTYTIHRCTALIEWALEYVSRLSETIIMAMIVIDMIILYWYQKRTPVMVTMIMKVLVVSMVIITVMLVVTMVIMMMAMVAMMVVRMKITKTMHVMNMNTHTQKQCWWCWSSLWWILGQWSRNITMVIKQYWSVVSTQNEDHHLRHDLK